MNTDEIKNRLNYVVNDFKLQHLLDKNIFKLSGGEKQKIAGASVSAVFPDIFVLDEPSSNLDSESSWDLEDIIKKWKESGKTVIVAEHKLFFLSNVVDRVIFMEKCKKLLEGTPKEVFSKIDTLKNIGLDVPCMTELSNLLKSEGLDIRDDILTVDEMVMELCQL